jgi:orotidine-5'-phosphate decarboxylase
MDNSHRYGGTARANFLIVALDKSMAVDALKFALESELLFQFFSLGLETFIFDLEDADFINPITKLLVEVRVLRFVE